MARSATARLKVSPPLGRMPVLQFIPPAELAIDATYQRSIQTARSQALIRRIAQHWNWDLCQPLVVSRRDGNLFVIDGQHRLEAARLRSDILQLPCVVVEYSSAVDEAANFVHLNQQRRALSRIDVFKAAQASEDPQALGIAAALTAATLRIAPHENYVSWKPGMVANIGGIEAAWRNVGPALTSTALAVLGKAWPREVLRYAGTIFPGIVEICRFEARRGETVSAQLVGNFVGGRSQLDWRGAIMAHRACHPGDNYARSAAAVLRAAWLEFCDLPAEEAEAKPAPVLQFRGDGEGLAWCEQCEMRVSREQAEGCKSRWCSLKAKAAA